MKEQRPRIEESGLRNHRKPEPMPCYLRNDCSGYEPYKCINRDFVDNCRYRIKHELNLGYI